MPTTCPRLTNQELRHALTARRAGRPEPSWVARDRERRQRDDHRAERARQRSAQTDRNILQAMDQLGPASSYTDIVEHLRAQGLPGSYTTVRQRLKRLVAEGHVMRPADSPHPVPHTLTSSGRKIAR